MNETIACPSCQRKVTVPTQYFGKQVQCPQCQHTFVAVDPTQDAVQPIPVVKLAPEPVPRRDEWEDRGAYRMRRGAWDSDLGHSDDIALRRPMMPHRGAAVLTVGLLSLVLWFCAPVLGPVAWLMGYADLKQMRAGQMDPSGEGMTQAGMVLGMVMTILAGLGLGFFCFATVVEGIMDGF